MELGSVNPLRVNVSVHALRRAYRRVERNWKGMHVSFGMLREALSNHKCALKQAKTQYFYILILNNSHRPKILFSVLSRQV